MESEHIKPDAERIAALEAKMEMLNKYFDDISEKASTIPEILNKQDFIIAEIAAIRNTIREDFKELKKSVNELQGIKRVFVIIAKHWKVLLFVVAVLTAAANHDHIYDAILKFFVA